MDYNSVMEEIMSRADNAVEPMAKIDGFVLYFMAVKIIILIPEKVILILELLFFLQEKKFLEDVVQIPKLLFLKMGKTA